MCKYFLFKINTLGRISEANAISCTLSYHLLLSASRGRFSNKNISVSQPSTNDLRFRIWSCLYPHKYSLLTWEPWELPNTLSSENTFVYYKYFEIPDLKVHHLNVNKVCLYKIYILLNFSHCSCFKCLQMYNLTRTGRRVPDILSFQCRNLTLPRTSHLWDGWRKRKQGTGIRNWETWAEFYSELQTAQWEHDATINCPPFLIVSIWLISSAAYHSLTISALFYVARSEMSVLCTMLKSPA